MSLRKHFTWNLVGSFSPLLIGVFSIPFLIDRLGIESFGILTLIWALIGYFSLFDFGLGRALTQVVSKYSNNLEKIELYSSLGTLLIFYVGLFGGFVLFVLCVFFPVSWLGVGEELVSDVTFALIFAAIGIPITTITSGYRGILEGFFKFKESNLLRIYLGVGNFLLPVIVVLCVSDSLAYITCSLVLVRLAVMVLTFKYVIQCTEIRYVKMSYYKTEVKELLSFGSWMTLSNIVSPLMVTADRFIVSSMIGAAVVAYYTVPFEVIIRILLIPAALTGAFFPLISRELASNIDHAKKTFDEKIKLLTLFMILICLFVSLLSKPLLTIWVGPEFAEKSWIIAVILTLGICFNGIAQLPHAVTQASGDTKSVACAHVFEFFLYIPILFLAVKNYGLYGAALAWALRAVLDLFIMVALSRNVFKNKLH